MRIATLLLVGGLLALAGCAPATPTPRADGVILDDDFANPQSGWDDYSASDITTTYADGQYRIQVQAPNLDAWGLAGLDLNDMRIAVDTRYGAGPADNTFGVLCRHTVSGEANNFYFFLISSDGYYAMGKVVKDAYTFLNPAGDYEALAAIQTDPGAVNRLEAVCQGDQLAFTVNGVAVATAQDAELTHGDVGLIAGSFNTGGVEILFDNVVVRQP